MATDQQVKQARERVQVAREALNARERAVTAANAAADTDLKVERLTRQAEALEAQALAPTPEPAPPAAPAGPVVTKPKADPTSAEKE